MNEWMNEWMNENYMKASPVFQTYPHILYIPRPKSPDIFCRLWNKTNAVARKSLYIIERNKMNIWTIQKIKDDKPFRFMRYSSLMWLFTFTPPLVTATSSSTLIWFGSSHSHLLYSLHTSFTIGQYLIFTDNNSGNNRKQICTYCPTASQLQ